MTATTVIGLTGPSCSGKSSIARVVAGAMPNGAEVLCQDLFFRDPSAYPADANFYELRWLHVNEFLVAFDNLASGDEAEIPTIDYRSFERTGQRRVGPTRVLIVEGMSIFRLKSVFERCNTRVYLDVDFSVLGERKRERDREERNKLPHIIDAQLAWMKDEYERDASLRCHANVWVIDARLSVEVIASMIATRVAT